MMTPTILAPSDRRAFARLSGSTVPWLSATTPYSIQPLGLIDISDGGALIETERRAKPGEREALVLCGQQEVKVVARVLRVEIVRLQPIVVYRSAVRFLRPISVEALRLASEHPPHGSALPKGVCPADEAEGNRLHAGSMIHSADRQLCAELCDRLDGQLHQLEDVHQIQICSSIGAEPPSECQYFEIPGGISEGGRFLRVSFVPARAPTANAYQGIEGLVRLAVGLPTTDDDVDCRLDGRAARSSASH